jgi:hypothetical protein
LMRSIDDRSARRIHRFGEEALPPALRKAFGQRPNWRIFDANQLFKLMFLHGYLSAPPEDLDVETALPSALEDREGAA